MENSVIWLYFDFLFIISVRIHGALGPAVYQLPLRLHCLTLSEGRVNQSMPLHQRHVTLCLPSAPKPHLHLHPSWSLFLLLSALSFFTQRLWLCVIRRCDTFPVAHTDICYPARSFGALPTALPVSEGAQEDLLSGPARLYNPLCHLHTSRARGEPGASMTEISFHLNCLSNERRKIKSTLILSSSYMDLLNILHAVLKDVFVFISFMLSLWFPSHRSHIISHLYCAGIK